MLLFQTVLNCAPWSHVLCINVSNTLFRGYIKIEKIAFIYFVNHSITITFSVVPFFGEGKEEQVTEPGQRQRLAAVVQLQYLSWHKKPQLHIMPLATRHKK